MFHIVNISNTMGSWSVCSAHDNGTVQPLEILASSALCSLWGLKTVFRFCEQLQLPDWAVNHPVPAHITLISWSKKLTQGSPVAQSGKESFAGDSGLIPASGISPWRREWQPTPVALTRESHGQRSLVGYSPWACREGHDWGLNHWTATLLLWFLVIQPLRSISPSGDSHKSWCCQNTRVSSVVAHGILPFLSMRLREWNASSFLCNAYDAFLGHLSWPDYPVPYSKRIYNPVACPVMV